MYYRVWQKDAGLGAPGFSALLSNLLGQITFLDRSFNIYGTNSTLWIDWCKWADCSTIYYEGDDMPYKNSFDYYFINPTNTDWASKSFEENPDQWITTEGQYMGYPDNQAYLKYARPQVELMAKYTEKYFVPRPEILSEVNEDITKHKVLGVHCRRSCLGWAHNNLDLQYNEEQYFSNAMKVFQKGGFEKIYLATEETAIYNYFMERIPELIITQHNCYRVAQTESAVFNLELRNRPLHRYLCGKEVLIDILSLSKCDSLLCYKSGVTNIATYYNNLKYTDIYYHPEVQTW